MTADASPPSVLSALDAYLHTSGHEIGYDVRAENLQRFTHPPANAAADVMSPSTAFAAYVSDASPQLAATKPAAPKQPRGPLWSTYLAPAPLSSPTGASSADNPLPPRLLDALSLLRSIRPPPLLPRGCTGYGPRAAAGWAAQKDVLASELAQQLKEWQGQEPKPRSSRAHHSVDIAATKRLGSQDFLAPGNDAEAALEEENTLTPASPVDEAVNLSNRSSSQSSGGSSSSVEESFERGLARANQRCSVSATPASVLRGADGSSTAAQSPLQATPLMQPQQRQTAADISIATGATVSQLSGTYWRSDALRAAHKADTPLGDSVAPAAEEQQGHQRQLQQARPSQGDAATASLAVNSSRLSTPRSPLSPRKRAVVADALRSVRSSNSSVAVASSLSPTSAAASSRETSLLAAAARADSALLQLTLSRAEALALKWEQRQRAQQQAEVARPHAASAAAVHVHLTT